MKIYSGECEHGECGLVAGMKDSNGHELFVGDIIVSASVDSLGISSFYSLSAVVDDRPALVGRTEYQKPFVMGLASVDIGNDPKWYVKKIKDWRDCVDGEHWRDFGFSYHAS